MLEHDRISSAVSTVNVCECGGSRLCSDLDCLSIGTPYSRRESSCNLLVGPAFALCDSENDKEGRKYLLRLSKIR